MTLPAPQPRYTIDEYVRRELSSEEKHEFQDGEILAMSGGSPEHSLIIVNTSAAIHTRLRGRPCRNYESNLRIRIPSVRRYVYADGSIFCAPLEYDSEDTSRNNGSRRISATSLLAHSVTSTASVPVRVY